MRGWLQAIEDPNVIVQARSPKMGRAKIAFILAFRQLISNQDYESCLEQIIKGGGDTDTNACIAGALLGAAVGFRNIPNLPF